MASQTYLGRDILGQYWGLMLIAFLSSGQFAGYPYTQSFRDYAAKRAKQQEQFFTKLQELTGLSCEVVNIGRKEAPWNIDSNIIYDLDTTLSEVALQIGRWPNESELEGEAAIEIFKEAARKNTRRLVEALIAALFSFGDKEADVLVTANTIMTALSNAVGPVNNPCIEIIKDGFELWLNNDLSNTLKHEDIFPEYKDWLINKIKLG